MQNHPFQNALCLIGVLFIAACASESNRPLENQQTFSDERSVQLPIPHGKWVTWRCKDGSHLETRLEGDNDQMMALRYQGAEHVLSRQPSSNPAVYQDGRIAFFSNGQSAVVGQPNSSIIYNSGCNLEK